MTVWIGFWEVRKGGTALWGSLSNPTPKIARGTISGTLKNALLGGHHLTRASLEGHSQPTASPSRGGTQKDKYPVLSLYWPNLTSSLWAVEILTAQSGTERRVRRHGKWIWRGDGKHDDAR